MFLKKLAYLQMNSPIKKIVVISIAIAILLVNKTSAKCQPGYPMNGFEIIFNASFVQFPDSLLNVAYN